MKVRILLFMMLLTSAALAQRPSAGQFRPTIIADSIHIAVKSDQVKGNKNAGSLFYQLQIKPSSVQYVDLRFSPEGALILTWNNGVGQQVRVFEGKFRKNGVYEIFLSNVNFELPPFFPIIYSKKDIWRIRMRWLSDTEVEVSYYCRRGGNLLFLANGYSERGTAIFVGSY